MSIDEVMALVISLEVEANYYDENDNASVEAVNRARVALRAAIEQHVAEEVAKEREVCAELADECATWGGSNFCIAFERLAAAIRARAEKGTP